MKLKYLLSIVYIFFMFSSSAYANYEGEELGYVDEVRISGREFESLNKYEIEFYREDLVDGKITIQGILESELKHLSVDKLNIEISVDGGDTWKQANGHEDWSFSFAPESGKVYSLSLRVVESVSKLYFDEPDLKQSVDALPSSITIAGFTLTPNADASYVNGKLSGSGTINIPYLSNIVPDINNTINVNFQDLSITNNIVTNNEITYTTPFTIVTPLVEIDVTKLIFSPILENNKIEGLVRFTGVLASAPNMSMPTTSKLFPSSFYLSLPFNGQNIDIWKKRDVKLLITEGSVDLGYSIGSNAPTIDLNIPTAKLKLGTLLTDANNLKDSIALDLINISNSINITIDKDAFLLGTGIRLPQGLSLGLDLSTLENPKISFTNSIDFSGYTNPIATALSGASISASINTDGFDATVTASGSLKPLTILSRGGGNKDVKILFLGDAPSFSISMHSNDTVPQIDFGAVSANLHLGDILQSAKQEGASTIVPIVAQLNQVMKDGIAKANSYKISIADDAFLLGSGIKLPSGFELALDLTNLSAPKIDVLTDVNFDDYDNIIAKKLVDAKIDLDISTSEFSASITASKDLAPITILERGGIGKDVRLVFADGPAPSFSISITNTSTIPEFSVSNIDAKLEFGDLLQEAQTQVADAQAQVADAQAQVQQVTALVSTIQEGMGDAKALSIFIPADVSVLNSHLRLIGASTTFNMATKTVNIGSSVNLDGYDNPIFDALSGSDISASISPSGFSGSISVNKDLDDVVLLDRGDDGQDVKLKFTGRPSASITIDNSAPSFSFTSLSANIDFGDLLQSAKNQAHDAVTPVIAQLSTALDDATSYTLTLSDKVYLMGSDFALDGVDVGLNINTKTLSLAASADLKDYTSPIIKAFDGASFSATVLPSSFSATLSKEGSLPPVTILDRGGEAKNVSLEFSSVPTVELSIANGDIDFGITGGKADLHFGDLLENATAELEALKSTKDELVAGAYSWEISGSKKLLKDSAAQLSTLLGEVDLSDLKNPTISLNADIDLSPYKGMFKDAKPSKITNAIISKDGFSASFSVGLGSVNIWEEKKVQLTFTKNPTLDLEIKKSSFSLGLSDLAADLDFGELLDNATASIGDISQGAKDLSSDTIGSFKDAAQDAAKDALSSAEDTAKSTAYGWYIDGKKELGSTKVMLENLGGSLDLSDITNPSIVLNAIANVPDTHALAQYISNAGISNAKISKNGFDGTLTTTLKDINIWPEKEVKVVFDEKNPPSLNLKLTSSGLKLSVSNLDADLHLGKLLSNVEEAKQDAIAQLKSLEGNLYSWKLTGKNQVADSKLYLENLLGSVNLSDLSSPIINLNASADLSAYGDKFSKIKSVALANSTISKDGFKADITANIDDITIWQEKQVVVGFKKDPTLHIELTRSNFAVGVSDLDAEVKFGKLLDGEMIDLKALQQTVDDATQMAEQVNEAADEISDSINDSKGIYTWNLQNEHTLLKDSETSYVTVSKIGGTVNLKNLTDPIIVFDANASFENYQSDLGNLGNVQIREATISKSGIAWNLIINGASAEHTIYDYNSGNVNDNVRVELSDINGHVSNTDAGISNAKGILYFGKLFTNAEEGQSVAPVTLTYADSVYSFNTDQVLSIKKDANTSITLSRISGSISKNGDKYEIKFDGDIDAKADILTKLNVGKLTFSNFEIKDNSFTGNITAAGSPLKEIDILNGNANIQINAVGLNINVTPLSLPKIKINRFDAKLDISQVFSEIGSEGIVLKSVMADIVTDFNTGQYSWNINKKVYLQGAEKLLFENLQGDISIDDLSLSLGAKFTYADYPDSALLLNSFTLDGSGIDIDAALKTNLSPLLGVTGLSLTGLGITVSNNYLTAGTIDLEYKKSKFLGSNDELKLIMGASIDPAGEAGKFTVESTLNTFKVANFADFTFNGLAINLVKNDFWVDLDGKVLPTNSILKNLSNEVSFNGLKISGAGDISIAGGESWKQGMEGASAKIAGLNVSLKELGFGIRDTKFFLGVGGEMSLGELGSAGTRVILYPNKAPVVEKVSIAYTSGAASFNGMMEYVKTDAKEEFQAQMDMALLDSFNVAADFTLGNTLGDDSYMYWKIAALAGGVNIPLAPLPISLYGFGGGMAYNMEFANNTWSNKKGNIAVMALATVGTTADGGYSWHGDVTILVQTNGTLDMNGDSYFLSERTVKDPENKLVTHVTFGTSPFLMHVTGLGKIKKTAGSFDLIDVSAHTDILFSSSDWHIYIGTKEQQIQLTAIEFLKGRGYLALDSGGLAVGVTYEFDISGSCCAFYGKLYGGAGVDLRINARPFYVDAQGRIYIGLEAGVHAFGTKYAILNAEANIAARFRAPNPTFIQLKAKMHYSIAGGLLSGTYRTTFWMPEKPEGDLEDLSSYPLISMLDPENDAANITSVAALQLTTTVPADETMELLEEQYFVMRIHELDGEGNPNGNYVNSDSPESMAKGIYLTKINGPRLPMTGGFGDATELKLRPMSEMTPNTRYRAKAAVQLFKINGSSYEPYTIQTISNEFTISNQEVPYSMRATVSPNRQTKVVYPDTTIRIDYVNIMTGVGQSAWNNVELFNPVGEKIPITDIHHIGTTDGDDSTRNYLQVFKPSQALKPVFVYENKLTGEVRKALVSGDELLNPFTETLEDPITGVYLDPDAGRTTGIMVYKKDSSTKRAKNLNIKRKGQ